MSEVKNNENLIRLSPISLTTNNMRPAIANGCKVTLSYRQVRGKWLSDIEPDERKKIFEEVVPYYTNDGSKESKQLEEAFMLDYGVKMRLEDYIIDLTTPLGKIDYDIIKHHPDVALDKDDIAKKPTAKFVILNANAEAIINTKKYGSKHQAFKIVESFVDRIDQVDFLKLFGIDAEDFSDAILSEKVYEQADNYPKQVVELGSDLTKHRKERIMIFDAEKHGIIDHDATGFSYKDIFLGGDEYEAVNFLKRGINQKTLLQIMSKLDVKKGGKKFADTSYKESEDDDEETEAILEGEPEKVTTTTAKKK